MGLMYLAERTKEQDILCPQDLDYSSVDIRAPIGSPTTWLFEEEVYTLAEIELGLTAVFVNQ